MAAVLEKNYTTKFTTADLALLPEDGKLYEIIEGDLFVSRQPNWHHQFTCGQLFRYLQEWNDKTDTGVANAAPGVLFGDEDDVAPDVIWVSNQRLTEILGEDGKLHAAPEIVIEVVSPGWSNQQRDRQMKLKLYSRRGVVEYWIVDWQQRSIEIYSREDGRLQLRETLLKTDSLTSPLLPEFSCNLASLFFPPPPKS